MMEDVIVKLNAGWLWKKFQAFPILILHTGGLFDSHVTLLCVDHPPPSSDEVKKE
jgi:hypothetical protein